MSETISIVLDGTGALDGVPEEKLVYPIGRVRLLGVPGAMKPSGAPAVAIIAELPDGRTVVVKTSLALLLTAGDALKARYGDPRTQQSTRPGPKEIKTAIENLRNAGGKAEVLICSPLENLDVQDEARRNGLQVKHHPAINAGTSLICSAEEVQSIMERLT